MEADVVQTIALYGKGGIGKTTVASGLSAIYAKKRLKVLHVGCDPKHDSTMGLLDQEPLVTVIQALSKRIQRPEDIVMRGRFGLHCIECGGPEPGVGCGGRGVSRMFEVLEELDIVQGWGGYDVAIFDVLGDVVCGGFAAPLRQGRARCVYIVVSEGIMALFAANNIARALQRFAPNGVRLGGLVVNMKDDDTDVDALEAFAHELSTHVVAWIPRDSAIRKAELQRQTVVEYAPDSEATRVLEGLADCIRENYAFKTPLPTPIEESRFNAFIQHTFGSGNN